jgi:hypothetical protein
VKVNVSVRWLVLLAGTALACSGDDTKVASNTPITRTAKQDSVSFMVRPTMKMSSPAKAYTGIMAYRPPSNEVVLLLTGLSGKPEDETREVADILGYNDAQALAKSGTGTSRDDYGPVARLYAIAKDHPDEAEFNNPVAVAVVEVEAMVSMPPAYRRLGIDGSASTERYCIYVRHQGATWKAATIKAIGNTCTAPVAGQYNLNADRIVAGYTSDTAYPKYSARFVEDNAGYPAFGARCGNAWCEMGRSSTHQNQLGSGAGKTDKVLGWNDDQKISTPKATGGLKRGARATITPIDGLAEKSSEYVSDIGIKVATLRFETAPPAGTKYTTWQFAGTEMDMWMRHVGNEFHATFVPSGGTPDPMGAWFYAYRRPHSDGVVPGVARWLWDPSDEGVWISCDQGCCEISQEGVSDQSKSNVKAMKKGK